MILVRNSLILTLALSLAVGALACPDPDRRPEPLDARDIGAEKTDLDDPSKVVATVGDEKVTLGEVDEVLGEALTRLRKEYEQQVHELRMQGIDRLVSEKLLSEEAERKGFEDIDAFVQEAVERSASYPTDEEAREFFDENQAMMGGQSFEELQPRIMQWLHEKNKAERFQSLIGDLTGKAEVRIRLQGPRTDVDPTGPSRGPDDAKVTIVEFSNFVCPFCRQAKDVMQQIEEQYPDEVRFVFRQFPPPNDEEANRASEAALCADEQGVFWAMHDVLFEHSDALSTDAVKNYAGSIEGLDVELFETCLDEGRMRRHVMRDVMAGREAGVDGAPIFFVNGIPVRGVRSFEAFKEIIDEELRAAR